MEALRTINDARKGLKDIVQHCEIQMDGHEKISYLLCIENGLGSDFDDSNVLCC